MSQQITIDLANLDTMIAAMNKVGDQATQLDGYVRSNVCDRSGLGGKCALAPIGAALDLFADAFDQATDGFQRTWSKLADAAVATAHHQFAQDEAVADALGSYRGPWSGPDKCWAPGGDYSSYHVRDLALRAGEEGGAELDHDPLFDAAAATWDTLRDHVNTVLDWADKAGVHLGKLPETSLREAIVYPLSGNYEKIRANADSCAVLDDAMAGWGDNFTQIAAKSHLAIEGRAGTGLRSHVLLYGATMSKVGDGIGQARRVLDSIAMTSERIAVKVEKVIAKLAEKLARLAGRIAGRVNPVVGALRFAGDVVSKGPADAVKELADIVRDVKDVYDTIQDCFDLVDTVRAWAQAQAERLHELSDLADTVSALPGIGGAPGLGSIKRHAGSVAKKLDDVDFGGDTRQEAADLAKGLAGLDATDSSAPCPAPTGPVSQREPAAPLRDPATGGLVA